MSEKWTTDKALSDPVPTVRRIERYKPVVSDARTVEDLRLRLNPAIARLASADRTLPWEILPSDMPYRQQAPDPTLLRDQLAYWASLFAFDAFQARLERHPHYVAQIDWCNQMHFVHRRSSRPDAIPLLLLHGWPSSFYEFWDLIEPLTNPKDPSDPAFHVVIPSLPGFVWSSPPPSGKHYIGDLFGYARILNALMFGLGYGQGGAGSCWSGYAVQGTDWGSFHARVLANLPGTAAKAVHLNFLPPPPGKSWGAAAAAAAAAAKDSKFKANAKSKTQRATRAAEPVRDAWTAQEKAAYYYMQKYRPGALMHALLDSPAGLLSYTTCATAPFLTEKPSHVAMNAADKRPSSGKLPLDKFLATMTLYWQTGCIGTSLLPYSLNPEGSTLTDQPALYVKQPLAFSRFPREMVQPSLEWIGGQSNLVWAAQSGAGGHFPAMEVPQELTRHIRAAFSPSGFLHTAPDDHINILFHREGLWDEERAKVKDATARL